MQRSYRAQSRAAIAAVLPAALLCVDRRSCDRWGYYPLAFVWLFAALSRGASLPERFADARGWLRGNGPAAAAGRQLPRVRVGLAPARTRPTSATSHSPAMGSRQH